MWRVAKAVTPIWLGGAAVFCACYQWWLASHDKMAPALGETGDFLTGWLQPLALFWFVITVLLQREELKFQRLEFTKSREAAEEQAKHLEASNKVSKEQVFLELVKMSMSRRLQYSGTIKNALDKLGSDMFEIEERIFYGYSSDKGKVEEIFHDTIGSIVTFIEHNRKYQLVQHSQAMKVLVDNLEGAITYYIQLHQQAIEAGMESLGFHLGGPQERLYRSHLPTVRNILQNQGFLPSDSQSITSSS